MSGRAIFLTHADVTVDPEVPVPQWSLSAAGLARHRAFAGDATLDAVAALYSSTETKAAEAAEAVAEARDLPARHRADLGENDRSATGYLPEAAFWPVVARFFAEPDEPVQGWETAHHAQARVVAATRAICAEAPAGDILMVSHGGVGTLLRCHLLGRPVSQDEGQPHPRGGCWFAFDRSMTSPPTDWIAI